MIDVPQGSVKIVGLPDLACFETVQQWAAALASQLAIEIPDTITNVVIGNSEPINSQTTALWIRRDNSGTFVGLYIYSSGAWVQIYPVPLPLVQFTWVTGSSLDIPTGYARADTYPTLTPAQVTFYQNRWNPDPGNPGEYLDFEVYFTG